MLLSCSGHGQVLVEAESLAPYLEHLLAEADYVFTSAKYPQVQPFLCSCKVACSLHMTADPSPEVPELICPLPDACNRLSTVLTPNYA